MLVHSISTKVDCKESSSTQGIVKKILVELLQHEAHSLIWDAIALYQSVKCAIR